MVMPDERGFPVGARQGGESAAAPATAAAAMVSPACGSAQRLKSLVRRFMLNISVLQGDVDGSTFRVIVADDGSVLPYFASTVFRGEFSARCTGRISSLAAPKLAESDADLAVVGANQYLLPLYGDRFQFIPKWVRIFLALKEDPDTMIGRLGPSVRADIRRNLRRMKEQGFGYEITEDPAWFDRFYHGMYVPFMEMRHGKLARVQSYGHVKSFFDKGFGLAITKDGRPVAASIDYLYGRVLCNTYMGVAGGDHEAAKEGASTALYYYSMVHAHSTGCTGIDFGNSRPFLSDGALRYKLKWGMQVLDMDDGIGVYAVAANTDKGREFMSRNKFFRLDGKRVVLSEDHQQGDI